MECTENLKMNKRKQNKNTYMYMPMDRVIQDAKYGVSNARIAWYKRDRKGASRILGNIRLPNEKT